MGKASKGRFITLEGGEGTGKSTQAARLVEALKSAGIDAIQTREPGGAPGAEDIRALLVRGDVNRWEPLSEVILNYAARFEHLQKTILPALAVGTWVVSDRFADSTLAYQGYGHGVDRAQIEAIHHAVVGDFSPDLTLVLDLPAKEGLSRATHGDDGGENRYENMDAAFHERLNEGFRTIAADNKDRCVVIEGAGDMEAVHGRIMDVVTARLGLGGQKT